MTNYVFQCFHCGKINMYKQADDQDVILQCWHCNKLQVMPPAKAAITLERFNQLLQSKIGAESINITIKA